MKFTSISLTAAIVVVSVAFTTHTTTCCGFVPQSTTTSASTKQKQQVLLPMAATLASSSLLSSSSPYSRISSPLFSTAAVWDDDQEEEDTASSIESVHRDADVIFSIIDKDGNGYLELNELTNHLKPVGYTEKVIQSIFTKMDMNNDGKISRQEFQGGMVLFAALQSAPGLGNYNSEFVKEIHEDADQVFQSVDVNGDGSIDVKELKNHLKRTKVLEKDKFSEVAMDRVFLMLDMDGNKRIEKEELRDAFARYSALRQAIGEGPNYK
jgi:Ca2+-binding EF-hand superfamily protein